MCLRLQSDFKGNMAELMKTYFKEKEKKKKEKKKVTKEAWRFTLVVELLTA